MLDASVANLVLVPIQTTFNSTLTETQWVATLYLLTMAISLPCTGWLSCRLGRERAWRLSLLGFVVASMVCALATNLTMLLIARAGQGLAAGIMLPAGQAILASRANPRQLGRLMGTVGLAVALGPALGPVLGGYLTDLASWRWIFWINVPLGLAAVCCSWCILPNRRRSHSLVFDGFGFVLIAISLPSLVYGTIKLNGENTIAWALAAIAVGASSLLMFIVRSRTQAAPLLQLKLLRRPIFHAACRSASLCGATSFAGLLLLPIYLQNRLQLSTANSGLMLLALGLGSAFTLPFAGAMTDCCGPARSARYGGLLMTLAVVPLALQLNVTLAVIACLLFLHGIGLALTQMPAMTAGFNATSLTDKDDGAVLLNIAHRLGGVFGAAVVAATLQEWTIDGAFMLLTVLASMALLSTLGLQSTDNTKA
ncbi:major facilitator superfamily transporter [Idiomarina xiamenensis 10-D-4]|uniref:Major facilitator superfamily transporter n=2 Tax=Idiomarina xiamenensis TaxID=1207041 RepID=K2JLK9_9GAMM|nr:major facilitator superfamily transporter [Idiomarina xiamenensis 10-D-4]